MTPFSIWLRGTGYWGLAGGVLCFTALVLFAIFRPGAKDWVNHGTQVASGLEVTLETRRSGHDAIDVRLTVDSSSPVAGMAGFSTADRKLIVDRQVESHFLPPASSDGARFIFETVTGRFEWLVGRVFP